MCIRDSPGGCQEICREPAQRVDRALSSPWLKPGVSRALTDEKRSPAGPETLSDGSFGRLRRDLSRLPPDARDMDDPRPPICNRSAALVRLTGRLTLRNRAHATMRARPPSENPPVERRPSPRATAGALG